MKIIETQRGTDQSLYKSKVSEVGGRGWESERGRGKTNTGCCLDQDRGKSGGSTPLNMTRQDGLVQVTKVKSR